MIAHRPNGEFKWVYEGEGDTRKIVLCRGRFRSSVKLLPAEQWAYPVFTPNVVPLPPKLLSGLRKVMPFCSENATQPWATCIHVTEHHVTATNNIVIARADVGEVNVPSFLMPRWAAQFITEREEGLVGWSVTTGLDDIPSHASFLWEDGSWMRTTLILEKFPDVSKFIEAIGEPDVEITSTWRSALHRVGKMADDPVVILREDGVYGRTADILEVEDGTGTPVPEGVERTMWDLRYLDPVAAVATHWNPRTWPKPAGWRGPGIEGMILGRVD